jgi:hypothetical protein
MTVEERLRSLRLEADAGPLKASVLAACRERKLWRWTWAAAAIVVAVAIPANLAADRVGLAMAAKPAPADLPAELREALRIRKSLAAARPMFPRTVEDIR